MHLALVGAWVMPESPKYLITMKKYDEARKAITFIAKVNGRKEPFTDRFDREVADRINPIIINQSTFATYEQLESRGTTVDDHKASVDALLQTPKLQIREESQLNGTLKDLVKIKRHFVNLLIFIYVWIASSFNIYMLTYSLKYIPGNIFNNNLMSAITDIPIAMLGGYVYHRFGVKTALTGAFTLAVTGGVLILIFSEANPDFVPYMLSLAKGGIKITFDICYLANSIIFPTIFAGTAFGLCNLGAKIATILAPMLAEVDPPVPMIVFSLMAALGGIVSLFIMKSEGTTMIRGNKS